MIQDISPYYFDNQYAPVPPQPGDQVLAVGSGPRILSKMARAGEKNAGEKNSRNGAGKNAVGTGAGKSTGETGAGENAVGNGAGKSTGETGAGENAVGNGAGEKNSGENAGGISAGKNTCETGAGKNTCETGAGNSTGENADIAYGQTPVGEYILPTFEDFGAAAESLMANSIYLFSVDDMAFYLILCDIEAPQGFDYLEFPRNYKGEKTWLPLVFATALHLNAWYRDTQYCGRCGKKMSHHDGMRAMTCECGNLQFPRIAPVVLAGIVNGDKIVATRYRGRPYKGLALNAGFVEIGESLEGALRREIREEVGLEVGKIHYYGSQPWGLTGIVMAGFFCEIEGDDTITMDDDELSEAFWISRDELTPRETTAALTATMFEAFRTGEVKF